MICVRQGLKKYKHKYKDKDKYKDKCNYYIIFIDFMVYKLFIFYFLLNIEGTAFKHCFETKILYIIHPLQYSNGNYTFSYSYSMIFFVQVRIIRT